MYVDAPQTLQTAFLKPAEKPPVFSLAGLIAWLETQDPAHAYRYGDIHDCLLSRYFRAAGLRWAMCSPTRVRFSRFSLPPLFRKQFPRPMDQVAVASRTYGEALRNARALAAYYE